MGFSFLLITLKVFDSISSMLKREEDSFFLITTILPPTTRNVEDILKSISLTFYCIFLNFWVRSITKGLVRCRFASTKIHFFCFRCFVHDRMKGCAFMRSVTEGLFFTLTALAPIIGFPLLYFNGIGWFLSNNRFSIH